MKKWIAFFLAAVICVVCMNNSVKAWNWSQERLSPAGTAGTFSYGPTIILSWDLSDYTHVCGGDVKAAFYEGTRGLQEGFARSEWRLIYVQLHEMDGTSGTIARLYSSYFVYTEETDYYHPGYFSLLDTNSNTIESDGKVELALYIRVNTYTGDLTNAVRSNIFSYEVAVVD